MLKDKARYIYPILLILLFISIILSGCDETRLDSDWADRKIVVDAKYDDWGSAQAYYDENEKVLINLANDNEYFYICLVTRNRGLEVRLVESGFMAWFDPDAGKKKTFGIRFPIGLRKQGMSLEDEKRNSSNEWYDQEDQSGVIDREKEKWQNKEFNKHLETVEGLQDQLEVVSEVSGHKVKGARPPQVLNLEESAKLGIEVKTGRKNDYFVYELKIPLVKSIEHPNAIGAKPGKPFGLGLEIAKFDMSKKKDSLFNEEDGKDSPAPSKMGPPDMRSGDTFQLWAIVTLSSGSLASN